MVELSSESFYKFGQPLNVTGLDGDPFPKQIQGLTRIIDVFLVNDAEPMGSDLTLDSLVMVLIGAPIVFPVTATYDALLASGRLDLLSSGELRRLLATWVASMADLAQLEREARVQMDQRLLPFLWDYVPIVTLDLNTLEDYEGSTLERSRFPSRYQDLLRSLRFENAVEERMNSSKNAFDRVKGVTESADKIVVLLEAELR